MKHVSPGLEHVSPGGASRARVVFALAVALLAISSAALWIRLCAAAPLAIAFYRLLYATVLLLPVGLGRARVELGALAPRERWLLLGAGGALGLHLAAWIASLAPASPYATSVVASATLVTLHPLLVAVATPLVLGRVVPRGAWAGMLIALVGGLVIALGERGPGRQHRLVGDLLAFAGAAAAAGYFLLGARLRARLGLWAYVLPVYAVAAATLGLLALATGTPLGVPSLREHALFVALAVGPMVLGHTVLNWALAHVPAWVVSSTILAEPVASTALVVLVLGETAPAPALAGAAVVLAGLALAMRGSLAQPSSAAR